jgi:geranylgeranyl diphosphate synthase type II
LSAAGLGILSGKAAALELIHTYSLIHDDLPSMDDDDSARQAFQHKMFGEATAILAGDALLTLAFELLAQPSPHLRKKAPGYPETAKAAGWQGMVGGLVLDTLGNGQECSLADIENIHHQKTGALLVAVSRLGAILAAGRKSRSPGYPNTLP